MKNLKTFLGKPYPVTDEWYAANIAAFPGIEKLDLAQLRQTIRGLHQKHDARAEAVRFGALPSNAAIVTDHELALISACDAVLNFNARVVALAGRDPALTYGEQVGIDNLNMTNWSPDTCGCEHRYLWRLDHGGEGQPEREHHPHAAVKRCEVHAHLVNHEDHYAEILAENQHKNVAVATVATALGVLHHEVQWRYDAARGLNVSHPAMAASSDVVMKALSDHPIASKRPVNIE